MRGDRRKISGGLLALALLAGACAGSGEDAAEPTATTEGEATGTTAAPTTTIEPALGDGFTWTMDFSPVEVPAGVLSDASLFLLGITETDLLDPNLPPVVISPVIFAQVVDELAAAGYDVEFISQTTDIDLLNRGIAEGVLDMSPEFRSLIDAYDATFDGTAANAFSAEGEALLDAKRDEYRAADAAGDLDALEALLAESETWEDQIESPSANFYSTVRDLRLQIEQSIAENR